MKTRKRSHRTTKNTVKKTRPESCLKRKQQSLVFVYRCRLLNVLSKVFKKYNISDILTSYSSETNKNINDYYGEEIEDNNLQVDLVYEVLGKEFERFQISVKKDKLNEILSNGSIEDIDIHEFYQIFVRFEKDQSKLIKNLLLCALYLLIKKVDSDSINSNDTMSIVITDELIQIFQVPYSTDNICTISITSIALIIENNLIEDYKDSVFYRFLIEHTNLTDKEIFEEVKSILNDNELMSSFSSKIVDNRSEQEFNFEISIHESELV